MVKIDFCYKVILFHISCLMIIINFEIFQDPNISLENKIEIENYWQPLIKEHDKLQAEKLNCKENVSTCIIFLIMLFIL